MIKYKLLKLMSLEEREKYYSLTILLMLVTLCFSFFEIHSANKLLKSKNQIQIDKSIFIEEELDGEAISNIDEFIQEYLITIFESDENSNLSWLMEHSEKSFYNSTLKKHLETRFKNKITSKFNVSRIFQDNDGRKRNKYIIFGEEIFMNKAYKNRNLVIELLIDLKSAKVQAIQSIKELNE